MSRKYRIFVLVLVVCAALDQGTKALVRSSLAPDDAAKRVYRTIRRADVDVWCQLSERQVRVIPNFFDICYSENTGVVFGLGKSVPRWVWISVGLLALGMLLVLVNKTPPTDTWPLVGLGLVASGAIGNIADRAIFGYVTDFIVWRYHEHAWPTFNVADAALVVGVGLMLLTMRQPKTP